MSDKISTQNMGTSGKGLSFVLDHRPEEIPFVPSKRSVFTELEREELKDIFRSVLEEYGLIKMR